MRSHPAGALEDAWNLGLSRLLNRRGWRRVALPYVGYGNQEMLRVLARVILVPEGHRRLMVHPVVAEPDDVDRRGWRSFVTAVAPRASVRLRVAGGEATGPAIPGGGLAHTDRSGYLDVRIDNPSLPPGWHEVEVQVDDRSTPVAAPILVVDPEQTFGLVSDIDDTVIRTLLPRPLLAAYNTFVVKEDTRRPVPGMADLYRTLLAEHPGALTVYVSTGAWNVAPTLNRFLNRNGFPLGPLLLTDWGPTNTGWFRSGREHKRNCLRTLAADLPRVRWLLVGDDGQHDPSLYAEFARERPDRVRAIAIRQLTPTEQVLAHGTATERPGEEPESTPDVVAEVRAPDGHALSRELARLELS